MGIFLMDRVIYDRMAEYDSVHWWYRGRRKILAKYIERSANLTADARILEIGCKQKVGPAGSLGTASRIVRDRKGGV